MGIFEFTLLTLLNWNRMNQTFFIFAELSTLTRPARRGCKSPAPGAAARRPGRLRSAADRLTL